MAKTQILVSAFLAALGLGGAAACSDAEGREPVAGTEAQSNYVVFHGGTIYTGLAPGGGSSEVSTVEAMLVQDGRIAALGTRESVSARAGAENARQIDLGGGHAYAGFQDAHGHIEGYGAFLEEVDLFGCETFAELVRRVRARASEVPAGRWVTGRGWDQTLWAGKEFPDHDALSQAVPDHPVFVSRVDGHAGLANLKAMTLAGLAGEELPADPEGGSVLRDTDGRATGVFIDTAMDLVLRHVPEDSDEVRVRRILRAQDALLAVGLTCVHDMGVDPAGQKLFRGLQEDGRLRMRVVSYVRGNDIDSAEGFRDLASPPDARDVFTVAGTKFMVDGALGSRGAALLQDYSDQAGHKGLSRFDVNRFTQQVVWSAEAGLQPATHAIGDRANRLVLDSYARAAQEFEGFAALRPRIEHAQVVDAADMERFGMLSILPSMQPTHATSDMRWVPDRLGATRSEGAYAWQSVAKSASLPMAFGSDFPVERPHPLEGFYAAVTRQDRSGQPEGGFFPEQRFSAAETLAAFTSGAAAAAGQESRRGRLARGYACDMTVVDLNLAALGATSASDALDAKILMTIVNGEVLYSSR